MFFLVVIFFFFQEFAYSKSLKCDQLLEINQIVQRYHIFNYDINWIIKNRFAKSYFNKINHMNIVYSTEEIEYLSAILSSQLSFIEDYNDLFINECQYLDNIFKYYNDHSYDGLYSIILNIKEPLLEIDCPYSIESYSYKNIYMKRQCIFWKIFNNDNNNLLKNDFLNTLISKKEDQDIFNNQIFSAILQSYDPNSDYIPDSNHIAQNLFGQDNMFGFFVQKHTKGFIVEYSRDNYTGFKEGDIILEVNSMPVRHMNSYEFDQFILSLYSGVFLIERDLQKKYLFEIKKQIDISKDLLSYEIKDYNNNKYLIIHLDMFFKGKKSASDEIYKIYKKVTKENLISGVILNLRNNTGGFLDEAVNVADLFLDKDIPLFRTLSSIPEIQLSEDLDNNYLTFFFTENLVQYQIYCKDQNSKVYNPFILANILYLESDKSSCVFLKEGSPVFDSYFKEGQAYVSYVSNLDILYKSRKDKLIKEPLAILMNKQSASASELVIMALKGKKNVKIIGDEYSFGKASMQSIIDNKYKITQGLLYSPDYKTYQSEGIKPDIWIPSSNKFNKITEKNRLYYFENDSPLIYSNSIKMFELKELSTYQNYVKFKKEKEFDFEEYILNKSLTILNDMHNLK